MTHDVRQSSALAVSVTTAETWGTSVASVIDPSGVVIATPTVTKDTTSTTVASASNAYTLTLTSATGVVVGRSYVVAHNGTSATTTVDTISGDVVTLTEALPWIPSAADTFAAAHLSATVPASATATRGTHYAVVFTDTADASREERVVFHVVRRAFLQPLSSQDIRRLVTTRWPADVLLESQYREVAETVHSEIRDELLAAGIYAEAYIDPGPFRPAARVIARRILAIEHGLYPANRDPEEYLDSLNRERSQMIGRVIASIQPRDTNDDGAVDVDEDAMLAIRRSR